MKDHEGEFLKASHLAFLLLGITDVVAGTAHLTIIAANSIVTRTTPVLVLSLVVATSVASRTGVHSIPTDDRVWIVRNILSVRTLSKDLQEGVTQTCLSADSSTGLAGKAIRTAMLLVRAADTIHMRTAPIATFHLATTLFRITRHLAAWTLNLQFLGMFEHAQCQEGVLLLLLGIRPNAFGFTTTVVLRAARLC